ncbi:hypothetical protein BaRGS_00012170 [Batillaria attramentaria]|uniref:Mutator-like transposase domain-containing protein n=1 Tax=Batillaria attramentaria TaxID=370345 RepID=A0ABD0LBD2_9CAEN
MYREVDTGTPGPKPAELNVGLAVTIQNTPVGPTKAQLLLSGMNVPAPYPAPMQKTAEHISNKTAELNKRDMKEKLKETEVDGLGYCSDRFDQAKVVYLLQGSQFTHGFRAGYTRTLNSAEVAEHLPSVVDDYIANEVQAFVGFLNNPLFCSISRLLLV